MDAFFKKTAVLINLAVVSLTQQTSAAIEYANDRSTFSLFVYSKKKITYGTRSDNYGPLFGNVPERTSNNDGFLVIPVVDFY